MSKKPVFELSPAAREQNLCALCDETLVHGSAEVKNDCGHRSHKSCYTAAARTGEGYTCTHCGSMVIEPHTDDVVDEAIEQPEEQLPATDEDVDVDEEIDPFADQLAVAENPDNLMTQLFTAGNDLESIRTVKKVAASFRDLLNLGFVAPHFSMEVDGKRVAPMSQLLAFDGVNAASLRDELGLDVASLTKLGLTAEEFKALGYSVVVHGESAAAAADDESKYQARYSLPSWLKAESAAADGGADPEIEALIKQSFDQRKASVRFSAPNASQPAFQLVECHQCGGDDGCPHHDHHGDEDVVYEDDQEGSGDEFEQDEEVVPYEEDEPIEYSDGPMPVLHMHSFTSQMSAPSAPTFSRPARRALTSEEIREQYNRQYARSLAAQMPALSAANSTMAQSRFLAAVASVKLH